MAGYRAAPDHKEPGDGITSPQLKRRNQAPQFAIVSEEWAELHAFIGIEAYSTLIVLPRQT